jgi:putative toxin-antitoxin system antitoxin component (TIGR02293 family)
MVEAQSIAKILRLSSAIHSYAPLESEVSKGLPKKSVKLLATRISSESIVFCHKVVPRATYYRRRDRLSPVESEKTSRIARVVALAEHVWRNQADAREWMNTPLAELQETKSPSHELAGLSFVWDPTVLLAKAHSWSIARRDCAACQRHSPEIHRTPR